MDIRSKIKEKDIIQTLADLVSINSVNPAVMPDSPGEGKVAEYIGQFFTAHKIQYQLQEVFPGRSNIIGTIPGKNPAEHVVFESHMDVVSTKGMTISPFQPKIEGTRMYGRGSCDTKATMACMLNAIKLILDAGERPSATISIVGAVDEECGQYGVLKLVEKNMGFTAGVVGEPTELEVVRAHKGCVRWKIVTEGRSAHTSKPENGINAIVKMVKVIETIEGKVQKLLLKKTHPLVGHPALTISMIQGGTQVNFVPDRCEITLDRRIIPGEDKKMVFEEFEPVLEELRKKDPSLKVYMEEPLIASLAMETPEDAKIVQVGVKVAQATTGNAEVSGVPYGTDANRLVNAGVPCIVLGPGNIDQAHTADEWIDTTQLAKCTEMYARIMLSY